MKKAFLFVGIVLVLVIFYGFHVFKTEEEQLSQENLINVKIIGAVNLPGDYFVSSDTKLALLITYAGGFKEGADTNNLNLSELVKNNEIYNIYYLKIEEHKNKNEQLININTASAEELMTLSGIGPAKAKAIITYRNENGGFKKLEELKNVNGIGEKTYEELLSKITT